MDQCPTLFHLFDDESNSANVHLSRKQRKGKKIGAEMRHQSYQDNGLVSENKATKYQVQPT